MNLLLPYLGVALLLFVVSILWARQMFLTHKSRIEVIVPRKHQTPRGNLPSHADLGERIFGLEDWDFVSRNMPGEIQEMFLRERSVLAISWLRRTRRQVSLVMRAHVAAVRQIADFQLAPELKLALSYLLFLILCDFLIGWIWLCGPVRTREMIDHTVRTVTWLRSSFEQLMATVDPANCKTLRTKLNHRAVQAE